MTGNLFFPSQESFANSQAKGIFIRFTILTNKSKDNLIKNFSCARPKSSIDNFVKEYPYSKNVLHFYQLNHTKRTLGLWLFCECRDTNKVDICRKDSYSFTTRYTGRHRGKVISNKSEYVEHMFFLWYVCVIVVCV